MSYTQRPFLKIIFFLGLMGTLYYAVAKLQANLLLNCDVDWLLSASKKLLAGGTYSQNFFENNPPLILYLYFIPAMFAKHLIISLPWALRVFVYLIATISLLACYHFCNMLFSRKDKYLQSLIIIIMGLLYLLFPMQEFGQREHLLIMLTMPYFFMMAYRLQGQQVNRYLAFAVGLFAALGFALKPYFAVSWLLVEFYYLYQQKSFKYALRPETIVIFLFQALYGVSLILLHPDYIHIIVPFALRWTYLGIRLPWQKILFYEPAMFSCLAVVLTVSQLVNQSNRFVESVLVMAWVGFYFAYLIQQTTFFYHILPVFSVSIMLLILSLSRFRLTNNIFAKIFIVAFTGLTLFFLTKPLSLPWVFLLFNKTQFFGYFAVIFALYLYWYMAREKCLIGLPSLMMFFFGFFAAIYVAILAPYSSHFIFCFFLTVILLMMGFSFAISGPIGKKLYWMGNLTLGILLFSYPFFVIFNNYTGNVVRKQAMKPLVTLLNDYALHRTVYFVTSEFMQNILNETIDTKNAARISAFWMLPGMIKSKQYVIADKDFLINMVTDDIKINKPKLIFVDIGERKKNFNWPTATSMINIPFNYVEYFSTNKNFAAVWKHYHYLTTVESRLNFSPIYFYKYAVYMENANV